MDNIQNNKLIAKFMGATVDKYGNWKIPCVRIPYQGFEEYGDSDPCLKFTNECKDWEMEYHKSWDWLMPVVEKCYSNKENDKMSELTAKFDFWKIDLMYNAVVEYIKWYNENKK